MLIASFTIEVLHSRSKIIQQENQNRMITKKELCIKDIEDVAV